MFEELFHNVLKRKPLLKEEKFLSVDFPTRILHRDNEIEELMTYYSSLITNTGVRAVNQILLGDRGVGKTATAKFFSRSLEKTALKRGINLKYVHINCRKERTEYKVLVKINQTLSPRIPKRGYSPQDLMDFLTEFLEKEDIYLLLVLDEFDSLLDGEAGLLYSLVRINDDTNNVHKRLNIIGILSYNVKFERNISFLSKFFRDIRHYFQQNAIIFKPYTQEQVFDILKHRVSISFNQNTVSDEIINYIASIVVKSGDIRCGLNLLWSSSKIAEKNNLNIVTLKCVHRAYQELVPYSIREMIKHMTEHKLLFLFAIVDKLKNQVDKSEISLHEVVNEYNNICRTSGISPRSYSQLWNYVQEWKKDEIIDAKLEGGGLKGRKSFLQFPEIINLKKFSQNISKALQSKGIIV